MILIGTQLNIFLKNANWHTIRKKVAKSIYKCMYSP
nr:MAG TPA: hypothetical protein [Bacteriophage sp.]